LDVGAYEKKQIDFIVCVCIRFLIDQREERGQYDDDQEDQNDVSQVGMGEEQSVVHGF
jgi:hypothetical protein